MLLCCGEALIDMLPRKTEAGEQAFAPYPGGAVFNTAIAAARLGQKTGLFTGLSRDLFGSRLAAALTANGVDHSLAIRSDRPTTLAFVTLSDGHAEYAFYDENTAGRMLTPDILPALPGEVTALFFGGISLVSEPCGAAYEALMTREAAGKVTMIDPNIRPGFVTDEAAYRARIAKMIALADIVKVSDEDLHWLEGDGDTAELARGLLDRGPKLVCVTEGAKGATGYGAQGAIHVGAPKVEVVDTVGAGDTFNAGLLAALAEAGALDKATLADLDRAILETALTHGTHAAALACTKAGANPPRTEELAELLQSGASGATAG